MPDDCNKHETNGRTFKLMLNSFTNIIALLWHRALFVGAVKITHSSIQQSQYKSIKFVLTFEAAHSKALHITC